MSHELLNGEKSFQGFLAPIAGFVKRAIRLKLTMT